MDSVALTMWGTRNKIKIKTHVVLSLDKNKIKIHILQQKDRAIRSQMIHNVMGQSLAYRYNYLMKKTKFQSIIG